MVIGLIHTGDLRSPSCKGWPLGQLNGLLTPLRLFRALPFRLQATGDWLDLDPIACILRLQVCKTPETSSCAKICVLKRGKQSTPWPTLALARSAAYPCPAAAGYGRCQAAAGAARRPHGA